MDQISKKKSLGGVLFIEAIRKLCVTSTKNTIPLRIDTFAPSTYKYRVV